MHRRNLLKLLLVVAMAAPLGACKTVRTTQGGAVGVDRQQTMSALVSTRQLEQGAVQAYRQALTQASQKGQLNRDPALTARVRAIAQRLIPHTGVFRQDAPGWNWEVNVIASPEVNAWCMPGGKIAVYAGLVQKLDAYAIGLGFVQTAVGQVVGQVGHHAGHIDVALTAAERHTHARGDNSGVDLLRGPLARMFAQRMGNFVTHDDGDLLIAEVQPFDQPGIKHDFAAGHAERIQIVAADGVDFPFSARRIGAEGAGLRRDAAGDGAHALRQRRIGVESAFFCRFGLQFGVSLCGHLVQLA